MHKRPPADATIVRHERCALCGEHVPLYRDGDNLVRNLTGCPGVFQPRRRKGRA